jgi:hypothetical protein
MTLTPITPLTRGEFFSRMGILDEVDPLVNQAYRFMEDIERKRGERGHNEEELWHTSFHGSSFPGDNPYACGRHALYRLLDLPREPFTRQGRQFMDAGKDFENQLVTRFYFSGMLLSPPPWKGVKQLRFEDQEHWLSTSVDSILLPLDSNRPFVGEVKNVYAKSVDGFKRLINDAHPAYVRQTRCQIGMAHEATVDKPWKVWRCHNSGRLAIWDRVNAPMSLKRDDFKATLDDPREWYCPEHGTDKCLIEVQLEPVQHGWLYYASRDKPTDKFSFYFEYDKRFMDAGRRQLARWRDSFVADALPQTHFDDKRYSHPFGWQWTKEQYPCKWCDYGDVCRKDHKTAVAAGQPIKLPDSQGVEDVKGERPDYDYEQTKLRVLQRWGFADLQEEAA